MGNPLDQLLEEGIITEVVGRLQSGKEAEVFLVRFGERVVAAKVYKDRSQRSFKNNAAYKEGRGVRNSRDQRAMGRRSSFGKTTEEEAWKSAEADALYKLHAADVRVPTPVLFFEGVLLMELVLDADGITARRLIDTTLTAELANLAYHDMLVQLVRMLACDLIHGDLSPYNVLWGAAGATIIDFPQIVSAAQNSNSERFFLRDAENILGYFRQIDPRLNARRGDALEIWRAYMRRELTSDFVPTGRVQPPPPQRPIPIMASRQPSRAAAPLPQAFRGPERPSRAHCAPAQPQRDRAPRVGPQADAQPPRGAQAQQGTQQRSEQQRDNRPPQQRDNRPPQQRDNRPPQQRDNRPPQQRDNRPPQQRDNRPPQQRDNRPPQQRDNRPPQQQQRQQRRNSGTAGAPAGGQTRRAMPEVIVRPRVTSSSELREPPAATSGDVASRPAVEHGAFSKRR